MEKKEMVYEGKAKRVFKMDDPDLFLISYKDDATAFNGLKKGTIVGKGVVNNRMSNYIFGILEKKGIPTHLVEEINERDTIVKSVKIVPLEVIVRNIAAGSFSKRFGVEEGRKLTNPTLEFCLKDDDLGDPMINDYQILALDLATKEELQTITDMTFKINEALKEFFLTIGVELVDFKIEFGRFHDQIILADEISPDTCRLWDVTTHEKLDKDRFRRDLGGVEEAYAEVMKRLGLN
jgi:phosphoribosylaminoimidazole-succinocarboxamide synthase